MATIARCRANRCRIEQYAAVRMNILAIKDIGDLWRIIRGDGSAGTSCGRNGGIRGRNRVYR